MENLAVLLGTRRIVGLAFSASRGMFNISLGVARTPGLAHVPGNAAVGSYEDSTSLS